MLILAQSGFKIPTSVKYHHLSTYKAGQNQTVYPIDLMTVTDQIELRDNNRRPVLGLQILSMYTVMRSVESLNHGRVNKINHVSKLSSIR